MKCAEDCSVEIATELIQEYFGTEKVHVCTVCIFLLHVHVHVYVYMHKCCGQT